jgi:hypothetical protein
MLEKRRRIMSAEDRSKTYVRVRDRANNEFLCPLDALIDPKNLNEEELGECVDDATVGRYAGDIKVVDP